MREGLRSGKLRARPEKDKLLSGEVPVQKKLVDAVPEGANLGVLKNPESCEEWPIPDGAIISEKMVVSRSQCGEFVLTGEGLCNGALEDSRKRSLESCVEGDQCHEPIKKRVKEEAPDGGVHFMGRVLRSGTVVCSVVGKESAKGKKRAAELEKKRGGDHGFETISAQAKEDGVLDLVEPSSLKLKGKRGRPPKDKGKVLGLRGEDHGFETANSQAKEDGVFESVEPSSLKLKRKRGRPPKDKGKVLGLRKSERIPKTKQSVKKTLLVSSSNRGRRSNGDKYEVEKISPAKKGKHVDLEVGENVPSSVLSVKPAKSSYNEQSMTKGLKNEKDEVGLSRREQKGLVRERIVELLMSAGWTIEYRPRQKRHYEDAVYVSPDGKTHWSVTLAYNVLKMRYEAGDAESKAYKTGFVFSPIPEEELSILNKVIMKKREGKKKNGGKIDGAIKRKKHKGKLRFGGSANKRFCAKSKGKALLSEKERMRVETRKGTPLLIKNRKRRETQNRKRCALLARNSDGTQSDSENYVLYSGKRTILAWMIDLGIVLDKAKVQYLHPEDTQAKLGGTITRDGIHCDCCGEVITVSEFEAHADSKLRQPLENIYLENGMSMLQCQLDSWKKQDESGRKWFHSIDVGGDDPNDDTCGICGDGGDLVCCDGCPSTFHQSCLDIQKFPAGDWHCLYCSCKYCGTFDDSKRERNSNETTMLSALFKCRLCEEKYHSSCVLAEDTVEDVQILSSFCGKSCQKLYEDVGMLLGVKHELEEGYSFTLVHRFFMNIDISSTDISRKVGCNSKVAVALSVMDECFLPVSDHRSGIDMIHNILYNCGSNFSRLDFSGFYTAILEKGEEMISAASIRIHGNQLAEMPFIGTRYMYRRQGMCRRLLNAIESVLCSLKVQKLVIPAIAELKETWTSVFGFEPMDVSLRKSLKRMNILVFPGVDMLQKLLLRHRTVEEKAVFPIDLNVTCEDNYPDANTMEGTSPDVNIMEGTPSTTPDEHDINGAPTVDKSTLLLDNSINDASDITSDSVGFSDCLEEEKDLAQLGGLHDTEERNDVHPCKLPLSDNFARVLQTDLNWEDGKDLAESDESHDTAEKKNVPLNTVPSASDNSIHISQIYLNQNGREHSVNEREDLAHLDEPHDSAEKKDVPVNTLPSASDDFIHLSKTNLNHNVRKSRAQLDEPYDTVDRKAPLTATPSASDNFTHLPGIDLNRNDLVDDFALEEFAQIIGTDVDCKSNTALDFPASHTGHSEEISGDADAEKQVLASANGLTCSVEMFHDASDELLSTAECLSDSNGKTLLDELKFNKGAQQVSSAPSVGFTLSTIPSNQLLELMHRSPSNEVCPLADEKLKVVTTVGFVIPPVGCNTSPCQAKGMIASRGMVDSDRFDVRNQESFETTKSGTEKFRLLSPTTKGHGMSCEVMPDSNKQPVQSIHESNRRLDKARLRSWYNL